MPGLRKTSGSGNKTTRVNLSQPDRDMEESLKYASYIQRALFPQEEEMNRLLGEYFLLFQPCHTVSGDFYFVSGSQNEICIAVGDCTGHGVPGAFMSILGITFLNMLVNQNKTGKASWIVNQLREHVMKALSQTGTDVEQKDGIDIALCLIDRKSHSLEYSGAFNPVYHVRNSVLEEIPGDKMPVGIGSELEKPFTNHHLDLREGDMLYLFTDGFVDQFGGVKGKKFKYQPFRELLTETSPLPVQEQKMKLERVFDAWKGNLKQLDDVSIFGFRYHITG
jgi:serine phosphatase RsbU (regulator of sigma subunit)